MIFFTSRKPAEAVGDVVYSSSIHVLVCVKVISHDCGRIRCSASLIFIIPVPVPLSVMVDLVTNQIGWPVAIRTVVGGIVKAAIVPASSALVPTT